MVKRLLFALLMLILPLQAVWAAAGFYCQHERGTATATQHFGHHAHQHQAADKNDSGNIPASGFDGDCAFCHLGCVGVVTSSLDVPSSAPASPAVSPVTPFRLSTFLEGPERPKWASAV